MATNPAVSRRPLTDAEVKAALLSPVVFVDKHCWIRHKSGATAPFKVTDDWAFQTDVLLAMDREIALIVLKARQLGISWTADAYALWLCTANIGQTVLIISKGLREAQEELTRVRFMHRMLPPELRRRLGSEDADSHAPDNTTRIEFPDMDSRIISLPSTEDAGTSFTGTLVIVQELSKIPTAETLMTALTPTMADGGRIMLVSTAKGYSGEFYDRWKEASPRWKGEIVGERGEEGSYTPVFIPWHARPGRTQEWYDRVARTMKTTRDMMQEYPATPDEAFQSTSESVFAEEFTRHKVSIDGSRHPQSQYPTVHGADPGVNHAYAYMIEVMGDSVFVYAEIHLQNRSVPDLAAALVEENGHFGLSVNDTVTYIDPAASARNMQTLKTDVDVLAECGLRVSADARYSPAQRVGIIKNMLRSGRLWISVDCPDLLDALERAPWATRRAPGGGMVREDTYAKDGLFEHPLDALGYALCALFPPGSGAAGERHDSMLWAEQYGIGGSEFG